MAPRRRRRGMVESWADARSIVESKTKDFIVGVDIVLMGKDGVTGRSKQRNGCFSVL